MPVAYINSAGSASVTLNACDATSGWSALGGTAGAATSSYVEKEGPDCLEWGGDTGGPRGCYYDIGAGNEFSVDADDFSCWFLAAEKFNTTTYLTLDGTDTDAVLIRLSSAAGFTTNYVEYYRALSGVNQLVPSWNSLIASGSGHDFSSGTPNRASIRSFGVVTNQVGDNNTSFFTSTPDHGMDWYKLGRDIRITGTDGGSPWTFARVYELLEETKPFHGLIEKRENLYIINAGIIIGDGTTATTFEDDSAFVFIDQTSTQVKHDFRIKANATVTLGKTSASVGDPGRSYATGGVRITTRPTSQHSSDFVVEDGSTVNLYGCKIENWNNVDIGNAAGTNPAVKIFKGDFINNDSVDFQSGNLQMQNIRLHFTEGNEATLARILESPGNVLKDIRVFQTTRGLEIRANTTIEDYFAGDNTDDLAILEGVVATLKNPVNFNYNKLVRTT